MKEHMSMEHNVLMDTHPHLYKKRASNGFPNTPARIRTESMGTSSDKVAEIIYESVEENPCPNSKADITTSNEGKTTPTLFCVLF